MFILYLKIIVVHFKITSADQIIAKISKKGICKYLVQLSLKKNMQTAPSLNSSVLRILFISSSLFIQIILSVSIFSRRLRID